MSILSDIGNGIIQATTGTTTADIQAAEANLTLALGTMIALEAFIAVELFVLMVVAWKDR